MKLQAVPDPPLQLGVTCTVTTVDVPEYVRLRTPEAPTHPVSNSVAPSYDTTIRSGCETVSKLNWKVPDVRPRLIIRVSGVSAPETCCALQAAAGGACVTLTVRPAIVTVPVRCALVLARNVSVAVPEPLPVAGLTVTKEAPLLAVHDEGEQPAGDTETFTGAVVAAAATETEVGDTVKVHGTPEVGGTNAET